MRLAFMCLLAVMAIFSCKKEDNSLAGTPDCVKQKIAVFAGSSLICEGAAVNEYRFQGQTVYVFSDGSCIADAGAAVYDSACASIGFLGGIVGNTKVNGVEFSTAEFIKTLWKK